MVEFSNFYKCIEPEVICLKPEEQWSVDEFCELAADESWELDSMNEERLMALKHLFKRLIVPKEHWETIDYDKFLSIVKSKYQERLNEEE